MLRKWCLAATFVLTILAFSSEARAGMPIKQAGNIGIGLGSGTFAWLISGKYFLASDFSVQGVIGPWGAGGWYWGDNDGWYCHGRRCGRYRRGGGSLALNLDALYEGEPLVGNENLSLSYEIGGGGALGLSNDGDVGIAAAFVAGLQLNIHAIPIDVVLELRPQFHIINGFVEFWPVVFGGHIRYYF